MAEQRPQDNEYFTPKLLGVNVYVTAKNGMPALEFRKLFTDEELIKMVVAAAIRGQPVIIQPVFSNRVEFENALICKGICCRDFNTGDLHFLDKQYVAEYLFKF